jgi:C-terminal processing protease CtpA/Prc
MATVELSFPSGPLGIVFVRRGNNLVIKKFQKMTNGTMGPATGKGKIKEEDKLVRVDGQDFKDQIRDNEHFKEIMNKIKEAPDHHTRVLVFEKGPESLAADVREADVFANLPTGGFTVTLDKKDGGLGMLLRDKQLADDRVVVFVKTVKAGGSADHSGKIEANDVITHVNGKSVINNRLRDVADTVRGRGVGRGACFDGVGKRVEGGEGGGEGYRGVGVAAAAAGGGGDVLGGGAAGCQVRGRVRG